MGTFSERIHEAGSSRAMALVQVELSMIAGGRSIREYRVAPASDFTLSEKGTKARTPRKLVK